MALQHLRSSTANKRPVPGNMSDGQLGINTNTASPGLFFKDSNNTLVKVGPVHVGTTAPNASPASGGTAGNSVGEQWLDTTGGTYVFKVWDGSAWRSESGTFVDVNGDVMTGALGIIAGSAGSPGLYFSGDNNTGIYSPGADQVAISTGGSGRLLVDASGSVGVGTSTLHGQFNVRAAAGVDTKLSISDGFATGNLRLTSSTETFSAYKNFEISSLNTLFYTGGSERLRITSAGLVGVGTSSPYSRFTVIPSSDPTTPATANQITIGEVTGNSNYRLQLGYFVSGAYRGSIQAYDNGSPSDIILNGAGGRVGIGTSAPGNLLELKQESPAFRQTSVSESGGYVATFGLNYSSTDTVVIEGNPTGQAPTRIFRWGAGGNLTLNYASTAASRAFIVTDGATERARIDSSGRLLVGTSSATSYGSFSPHSIESTTFENYTLSIKSNSATVNTLNSANLLLSRSGGNAVGSMTTVASGSRLGSLFFAGADGTNLEYAAAIEVFVDGTPGADDMPGRIVLSTTADGASSPTERLRITSDGYVRLSTSSPGIQFNGDTAAANALNDYEEGTFTPSIVGTSTAGTATYGSNGQQGRYTKIGNRVFFDLYLAWSAHTGTGDLQITGLPFTVQNTTNLNRTYSTIFSSVALTAGSIGAAFSAPNTTTILLRQMPTGGGSVATVPMDTSAQISISGSFDV